MGRRSCACAFDGINAGGLGLGLRWALRRWRPTVGRGRAGIFDGVDVGAQIVARDAGCGFDFQDEFGGQNFAARKPLEHRGLRHTAEARHACL